MRSWSSTSSRSSSEGEADSCLLLPCKQTVKERSGDSHFSLSTSSLDDQASSDTFITFPSDSARPHAEEQALDLSAVISLLIAWYKFSLYLFAETGQVLRGILLGLVQLFALWLFFFFNTCKIVCGTAKTVIFIASVQSLTALQQGLERWRTGRRTSVPARPLQAAGAWYDSPSTATSIIRARSKLRNPAKEPASPPASSLSGTPIRLFQDTRARLLRPAVTHLFLLVQRACDLAHTAQQRLARNSREANKVRARMSRLLAWPEASPARIDKARFPFSSASVSARTVRDKW